MKKGDFIWIIIIAGVILFLLFPNTNALFVNTTHAHPYIMSFIKYGLLATMGELLGRRILAGNWAKPDGLTARICVWGFIGICMMVMFNVFVAGTIFLMKSGTLPGEGSQVLRAFYTSFIATYAFGPTFMLFHRCTDTYIDHRFGPKKISLSLKEVLSKIDYVNLVGFVMVKTLTFFWIFANFITFMVPAEYRILCAAFMSIFLGLILAGASKMKTRGNAAVQSEAA